MCGWRDDPLGNTLRHGQKTGTYKSIDAKIVTSFGTCHLFRNPQKSILSQSNQSHPIRGPPYLCEI